jgi:hypothetical protein
MSARRRARNFAAKWFAAVAWLLALAAARPAGAQQPGDQLQDRQLAYDAARSQYGAALDAWRVVEKQWNDAVDDHVQGGRAGDGERQNAALIRALDLSRQLDQFERRVANQRTTLDRARAALLASVERRIDQLTDQFAAARSATDRAALATLLRDLTNQQEQIEAERDQPTLTMQVLYFPSIQFDPRDTPEDLATKAQALRRKAERADSSLANIDREIAAIEGQVRRNRNVQSLVSGVERFDGQPPLGAPGRRTSPGEVRARPDSAGVARPELTPEQRLERLRLLRLQVQEAKRQFLERAGVFEEAVRRLGL